MVAVAAAARAGVPGAVARPAGSASGAHASVSSSTIAAAATRNQVVHAATTEPLPELHHADRDSAESGLKQPEGQRRRCGPSRAACSSRWVRRSRPAVSSEMPARRRETILKRRVQHRNARRPAPRRAPAPTRGRRSWESAEARRGQHEADRHAAAVAEEDARRRRQVVRQEAEAGPRQADHDDRERHVALEQTQCTARDSAETAATRRGRAVHDVEEVEGVDEADTQTIVSARSSAGARKDVPAQIEGSTARSASERLEPEPERARAAGDGRRPCRPAHSAPAPTTIGERRANPRPAVARRAQKAAEHRGAAEVGSGTRCGSSSRRADRRTRCGWRPQWRPG